MANKTRTKELDSLKVLLEAAQTTYANAKEEYENAKKDNETLSILREVARQTKMMYDVYVLEGFTDEQAMKLTLTMLETSLKSGGRL